MKPRGKEFLNVDRVGWLPERWHGDSMDPFSTGTTITRENWSFQWPFKVSGNCLKGVQQIKKHLFQKTHSISARTVRACGTWARAVPSLPSAQQNGSFFLSSYGQGAPGQGLWHLSGRGKLPAFLISYPSTMLQRQSSWWAQQEVRGFLTPRHPTHRMETLPYAWQAENTGAPVLPLYAHRTEVWCRGASWEDQRLPPLSTTCS